MSDLYYEYLTDDQGRLDNIKEVKLDELSPEDRAEFLATCTEVIVDV